MEGHLGYLASEVALDHVEGHLTRREAMRRLGLLGLSTVAASSLLSACARGADERGGTTTSVGAVDTAPTTTAPPATEAITYPGRHGTLMAAFAPAEPARGAVLVIHENRGLNDHIRSVAARLSDEGYTALAVDLLSEEGGTAALGDPANATAALGRAPAGRFVDDMRSSLDELARRQAGSKLGTVGFCFGGMQVWSLLAAGEPRLAAAVPFYGPAPDTDFSGSKAAVLAVYAERDERVNATREAAAAGLARAALVHEVRTFPGVDHAFFNDAGPRYDAAQAAAAYRAMLDWFTRHLG